MKNVVSVRHVFISSRTSISLESFILKIDFSVSEIAEHLDRPIPVFSSAFRWSQSCGMISHVSKLIPNCSFFVAKVGLGSYFLVQLGLSMTCSGIVPQYLWLTKPAESFKSLEAKSAWWCPSCWCLRMWCDRGRTAFEKGLQTSKFTRQRRTCCSKMLRT